MHVSLLFSWAETFWYYRDVAFKKADKNIRVTPWGIEKKTQEIKVEEKRDKNLAFRLSQNKTNHTYDILAARARAWYATIKLSVKLFPVGSGVVVPRPSGGATPALALKAFVSAVNSSVMR